MPWRGNGLRISPAMAPNYHHQDEDDELHPLRDRHYGMHGEVMALTVILIFSLFILSLLFVPHFRRRCRAITGNSEAAEPVNGAGVPTI